MADQKLDPNAPLTGDALKAAQAKIKEAIGIADEAIYKTVGDLPGKLSSLARGVEDALTLGALRETRERVERLYKDEVATWELQKKFWWEAANNGTLDGQPLTQAKAAGAIGFIQKAVKRVEGAIQLVNDYAKGTVIWKAVGDVFGSILRALNLAGQTLGSVAQAVLDITKKGAETVSDWTKYLPWIVGALVLGPLLLRSFAGYKKGGAGGAAEAAAAELESGRRAVGEGARKAWEGGKSLARRSASGGAISGAPRRRRSR